MKGCRDCENYNREHDEIYGEPICTLADETIQLRKGQRVPKWCPIKKANEEYMEQLNQDYYEHYFYEAK